MPKKSKLTTKKYWSEFFKETKLPTKLFNDYVNQIINKKIGKYIRKNYKTFIEIGGCPGRWSHFFYSKYKFQADSLEYDKINCIYYGIALYTNLIFQQHSPAILLNRHETLLFNRL